MARPILLAVDDDPEVLAAVERDLRARYREEYQVMAARSGAEALATAEELGRRGRTVALFLVDQRMPGMTGTALLAALRQLFPEARKVLLTAWADTAAAIESINQVGLDHYLLKPWDPPEERLYPVLDDLLAAWRSEARPPYDGIRVAGAQWSRPATRRASSWPATASPTAGWMSSASRRSPSWCGASPARDAAAGRALSRRQPPGGAPCRASWRPRRGSRRAPRRSSTTW